MKDKRKRRVRDRERGAYSTKATRSGCSKSSKRSRAVAVATQRGPALDAARGMLARCRVSNGRTTGILCDRKGGTEWLRV